MGVLVLPPLFLPHSRLLLPLAIPVLPVVRALLVAILLADGLPRVVLGVQLAGALRQGSHLVAQLLVGLDEGNLLACEGRLAALQDL